jgi:hypothetical protein
MTEPKSRWGSLLSGAVSSLESRLDTILADDPASGTAKTKGTTGDDESAKKKTATSKQVDGNTGLCFFFFLWPDTWKLTNILRDRFTSFFKIKVGK